MADTLIRQPSGLTAVTTGGLRIPCAVLPYRNILGIRQYRVVVEADWLSVKLDRVEIQCWPDDVAFVLDFGAGVQQRAAAIESAKTVRWVEL
jgi:hypothetical protein